MHTYAVCSNGSDSLVVQIVVRCCIIPSQPQCPASAVTGGELFNKRKQKADNWVVDESTIGRSKPALAADKFIEEQTQQQLFTQQQKQAEFQQQQAATQQQARARCCRVAKSYFRYNNVTMCAGRLSSCSSSARRSRPSWRSSSSSRSRRWRCGACRSRWRPASSSR